MPPRSAVPMPVALACLILAAYALPAPAGTVRGAVRSASLPNDPIVNARVTLFDPSLSFFLEARTDSQGGFVFEGVLPDGSYRVGACAPRFEYVEVGVVLGSDPITRDFSLGPETEPGRWEIVGNTLPEFFDATDIGIVRPDGKIFFCHDTVDPILFDPKTGQKSFPAGSWSEQGCMNGALLADGQILMIGGQDGSDPGSFRNAIPWVKSYDSAGNQWRALPDLQLDVGRWYPGVARLADGSLLAMGGGTAPIAARTATCERFDLDSEAWSFTGSMLNPAEFPPCALLWTGEVLATWWPPQLYSPSNGQWRATGTFNQANRGWPGHSDHSIVVLADGRVLVVGVSGAQGGNPSMGEIYDPATGEWQRTSNPGLVRFQTEVVQLPDGRVLSAGGETQASPPPVPAVLGIVKWSDLFDPGTDSWRRIADMNWFREYHAVTLLAPDGRVIMTGGTRIKFQYGPTTADIEAYLPPYLFRGIRPEITRVSRTVVPRGCSLELTIAPLMQITGVVLMGTGITTHWVDAGVPRRIVLAAQQIGDRVIATLPADPNMLPLGHYMVFAMVDDIPSESVIVRVSDEAPVVGDANGDGSVAVADVPAFVGLLLRGAASACDVAIADVNRDGAVDGNDVTAFVGLLLAP